MGFIGSTDGGANQIHAYSFEYELIKKITLPTEGTIISEMVLCHDEKWLVAVRHDGMLTIVNTETDE